MAVIGWLDGGNTDGDTYFLTRYGVGAKWTDLSAGDKTAALTTAHQMLANMSRFDLPSIATQRMKDAQCEQALFLIIQGDGLDRRLGLQAQGVTSAGVVKETYANGGPRHPVAPRADVLLESYDQSDNPAYAVTLTRNEEKDVSGA